VRNALKLTLKNTSFEAFMEVIVQSVVFWVVTYMRPHGLNPEKQGVILL
jgi:hypothetical protein